MAKFGRSVQKLYGILGLVIARPKWTNANATNYQTSLSNDADSAVDRNRARADAISMHGPDKLSPTPPPSAISANAIAIREKRGGFLAMARLMITVGQIVTPFAAREMCERRSQYCPCGRGKCVPVTTYKA
ncbi:hypothetical protein niasHT_008937 [Heterodera trifolii]|uniref:Uncharacterized protein n=1 Tax=Heterodera trifolii TaxID=157864 RepID=A0ABD2LY65_9BILA